MKVILHNALGEINDIFYLTIYDVSRLPFFPQALYLLVQFYFFAYDIYELCKCLHHKMCKTPLVILLLPHIFSHLPLLSSLFLKIPMYL